MNVETIMSALESLPRVIRLFEAYEEPIQPVQMKSAIAALVALQEALQGVTVDYSSDSISAAMKLDYTREQVEIARLHFAAYAPYGRSVAMRRLEQRRQLAQMFQEVERESRALVERERRAQPSQSKRSSHMSLVGKEEASQKHEDEHEEDEGRLGPGLPDAPDGGSDLAHGGDDAPGDRCSGLPSHHPL